MMGYLMYGIWDIPITFYWMFYFVLGVIGFAISYFNRYLFLLSVVAIFVFCVLDFSTFRSASTTPDKWYVTQVAISMAFAVIASLLGAVLNRRYVAKEANNI
jgi:phosphotransferase system  glucose/maltose/N-acetylglucosamine-specific IIC component